MAAKKPQYPGKHGVIDLGSGVKLYSESWFVNALTPFGMTVRSFRALCRNLGVPLIHIGTTRFVDKMSITLALRAVCSIGQPDFLAPGSLEAQHGRDKKKPDRYTRKLSPSYMKSNWEVLLREIIYARRLNMIADDKQLEDLVRKGVHRLTQAALDLRPLETLQPPGGGGMVYNLDRQQETLEQGGQDPWESRTTKLGHHLVNPGSPSSSEPKNLSPN